MKKMKVLLVLNPLSRGGKAKKRWEEIFTELRNAGIEWETLLWTSAEDVIRKVSLVRSRTVGHGETHGSESGFDAVVASGGDGTINTVVHGLMKNPDPVLRLGIVYTGTSPDFCQFHGIPLQIPEAVQVLAQNCVQPIDIMELERPEGEKEYFCCSCNPGMGAEVAETANRLRPWVGDLAGTLLALIRSLWRNRRFTFFLNGEKWADCNHLLVTKMPFIASGIRIDADLTPADGRFALCVLRGLSFLGWLRLIPRIYRGERVGEIRILTEPLTIESPQETPVEYDGDAHGFLPVRVALAPRKLDLIVRKH